DAAVDQAIEGVINGILFNQGHVCCAGSRLLVQESIADRFVDQLLHRVDRLRVGDPLDKNTDVGAINSAAQLARITELVDAGVA
ncbi:aldehyde dehydrogenase family protein, partial [Marinobacter sp.]|uniref:aldehyde dehydrogenase family protein n=1 Tax=Marinobacter sp. TaxID=50741 RepID=UPI0035C69A9E